MTTTALPDTRAITAEARQVRFWPTLLALIAWALIGLGRLAYRVCAVTWLSVAWTFVAVREGWRSAKAADQQKRLQARKLN